MGMVDAKASCKAAPLRLARRGDLAARTAGLWCAASLCICCGGAAEAPRAPGGPLLPYSGHDAALFDDAIEPVAVGYGSYGTVDTAASPKDDMLLRERTETGDAVVRARVVTVTSDSGTSGAGWRVGLHVLETIAGKRPPADDLTFLVGATAPAAGIVRTLEARLVGTTFVVFVREFGRAPKAADDSGDERGAELHYHFARDDKDELGAVRRFSVLAEVR